MQGNESLSQASIAVIGTGPRGISILERLGVRLSARIPDQIITLYVIDDAEVGCGRIWRTDQPHYLVMNNRCGEVTMFSGKTDGGAWRPGNGPGFADWWRQVDTSFPGSSTYAPRAIYGRYLKFVLDTIELNLPRNVRLERIKARVTRLERSSGRFVLSLDTGQSLNADRVVTCLGHPHPQLDDSQKVLSRHSQCKSHTTCIPNDSLTCMPLGATLARASIGVIGLGLTFYDVLMTLTIGRGGRFIECDAGLRYIRSGCEPKKIVAGSRRALPIPVRGTWQRPHDYRYMPRFFTPERVLETRSRKRLDFRAELLPWLLGELNYVYVQKRLEYKQAQDFIEIVSSLNLTTTTILPQLISCAESFGVNDFIELDMLATPFKNSTFIDQRSFRRTLIELVKEDVHQSELGDFHGPLKAVVEVLREARSTIRLAVDFCGLTSESHRDFVEDIGPKIAFLSTGPPGIRAKQLLALITEGTLEILGPDARFEPTPAGKYVGFSPKVPGYKSTIDALIDARVPATDLATDANPLVKDLLNQGIWRSHVNHGRNPFLTGALDTTRAPFNPIGRSDSIEMGMHALGITMEGTRWFTQVGIARLGPSTEFFRDADSIAEAVASVAYTVLCDDNQKSALRDQIKFCENQPPKASCTPTDKSSLKYRKDVSLTTQ